MQAFYSVLFYKLIFRLWRGTYASFSYLGPRYSLLVSPPVEKGMGFPAFPLPPSSLGIIHSLPEWQNGSYHTRSKPLKPPRAGAYDVGHTVYGDPLHDIDISTELCPYINIIKFLP